MAILRGDYKKGVLPPTVELAKPIQPTPAWRVKSGLIRRFGLVPQWVRTLSTHAIASQAQSHRLKPNLTRLDRNSLRSFRECIKKGALPLSAIGFANFAYPHGTQVFSSPLYVCYRGSQVKSRPVIFFGGLVCFAAGERSVGKARPFGAPLFFHYFEHFFVELGCAGGD